MEIKKQAFRFNGHLPPPEGRSYGSPITGLVIASDIDSALAAFRAKYPTAKIQCLNHIGPVLVEAE